MKILQTMSFSGGVAVVFYLIIKRCGRNVFSHSFYKKMLILAMVFFLFPFPKCIYRYADLLKAVFPLEEWNIEQYLPHTEWGQPVENYIEYTADGRFRINEPGWYIFTAGCLLCMFILLSGYLYRSKKIRKNVMQSAEMFQPEETNIPYDALKKCIHIKGNVELRISDYINSPITMGVFKPVIFLPKYIEDEKKVSFMLLHELNHIKQKDMLLTILSYIIIVLNFYNPAAYYLVHEWKRIVELSCDEKVMEGMTEEERKAYGLLLVEMAEKDMFVKSVYSLGFAREKLITERIKNVVKKRKMNSIKRIAAGCLMAGTAFICSLTVFAYEPDVIWKVDELGDSETEIIFMTEEMFEETINQRIVVIDGEKITYESKGYEQEFIYIDEGGNVIVEEWEEAVGEPKESCKHIYMNGMKTVHQKNADGGCTITYYTVVKCKNCGYVKSTTYYKSESTDKCLH